MPFPSGTGGVKLWRGDFSFALQGGAVSAIPLLSNDGAIPGGSIILGGVLEVTTLFTTAASGTGAIHVEAANDIVSATIVSGAPYSTTGRKSIIPVFTGATTLKTTVDRIPTFTIAVGAITAGVFRLYLVYT